MLCGGHGTCVDGVASFTCSCETGYSGELCEELGECGLRRGREEREGEGGGHAASWVCSQGTQACRALYCCCNAVDDNRRRVLDHWKRRENEGCMVTSVRTRGHL